MCVDAVVFGSNGEGAEVGGKKKKGVAEELPKK
jgi:hypothetical protein